MLTKSLLNKNKFINIKNINKNTIKSTSKLFVVNTLSVNEFNKIYNDENIRKLYQIIDVRESDELSIASLAKDSFIHLPLTQSNEWSKNIENYIDSTKPTICLCHHGMRSLRVATFLDQSGFVEVYNLSGGIHEYAVRIDTSIKTY